MFFSVTSVALPGIKKNSGKMLEEEITCRHHKYSPDAIMVWLENLL